METNYLQMVCNVIILLGGVAGAITGILALCGRPIKFFKKRRDKAERARREEIVKEVSASVSKELVPHLNEIHQQNLEQSEDIRLLTETTRNSIGAEILAFYEAHKTTKTITLNEKDAIEDLYKSYKAIKGNHYVDRIYLRIITWTVLDEEGKEVKDIKWWEP